MERNFKQTFLTKEDMERFAMIPLTEDERQEEIKVFKKRKNRQVIPEFIIMLISVLIANYFLSDQHVNTIFGMIGGMLACCMLFGVGLTLYLYQSNIKAMKRQDMMKIEIELLEKLPIEKDYSNTGSDTSSYYTFYPIIGRDTRTGYSSKIYLSKQVYENCEIKMVIQKKIISNNLVNNK